MIRVGAIRLKWRLPWTWAVDIRDDRLHYEVEGRTRRGTQEQAALVLSNLQRIQDEKSMERDRW